MNNPISLSLLLVLVIAFSVCLMLKKQKVALVLLLSMWTLFYLPFQVEILFSIGPVNIHYSDLVACSIVFYILTTVLFGKKIAMPNSTRWLMLFSVGYL